MVTHHVIAIVIKAYSPSCLGQETEKGLFSLLVKLSPADLSITHGGGFTLSSKEGCFFYWGTSSKKAVNTCFYFLWFDLAGNRTLVSVVVALSIQQLIG